MTRWICLLLLSAFIVQTIAHPRVKRQAELQDSENLTPIDVSWIQIYLYIENFTDPMLRFVIENNE